MADTKPIPAGVADFWRCDAETGQLFWIKAPRNVGRYRREVGTEVGSHVTGKPGNDYSYSMFGERDLAVHRVVWFLTKGEEPPARLDHIDADRFNNRIGNLRPATPSQNMANARRAKNNTSGFKGVCFDQARGKYVAYIIANGRRFALGFHDTAYEAHLRYALKASQLFGPYARAE